MKLSDITYDEIERLLDEHSFEIVNATGTYKLYTGEFVYLDNNKERTVFYIARVNDFNHPVKIEKNLNKALAYLIKKDGQVINKGK